MHFVKKHIKPITIGIISAGTAISLAGFVTFIVGGTHNVVKLANPNATPDPKTDKIDYITSTNAAGWLNYDSYYWTTSLESDFGIAAERDEFGKQVDIQYDAFLKYVTAPGFRSSLQSGLSVAKTLKETTNIEAVKTALQYQINYLQGLLDIQSSFNIAIIGCVLLSTGIVFALIWSGLLIYVQKKLPRIDKTIAPDTKFE